MKKRKSPCFKHVPQGTPPLAARSPDPRVMLPDGEARCQCESKMPIAIVEDSRDQGVLVIQSSAQEFDTAEPGTSDVVIVANRLPVQRVKRGRTTKWEISSGGLVSSMRSILRETQCTWIGWSGESDGETSPFMHEGVQNWPVPLTSKEVKGFYEGFSNRILWPLYHDAIRPPDYRAGWWDVYQQVNRRFAQSIASAAAPGGVVWIHDYHLQLVPSMLRELRADLRIGFFLHIPFPPQELFAQLPWRREILLGLLGADLLGFQTAIGAQNFKQVAARFAGASEDNDRLHFNGHSVEAAAFPISIDFHHFEQMAQSAEVQQKAHEFRARLGEGGSRKILLGVDRLDYTKGIDIRLQAFQELLRSHRATPDECVLVQIAIPSREHVAEYKELRVNVERLVGEIEGEFGDIGHTPIQYLHRSVNEVELAALYHAADVMVVTPLRDGMNLVAKEYVASRIDNTGVLVLSEFAGAARELRSALLVNPHDIDGLVGRMERALHMPSREQEIRMKSMRRTVKDHDVYFWADNFFRTLSAATHADA